jgi:predicted DNA-binding transcriptional regulator AlpA
MLHQSLDHYDDELIDQNVIAIETGTSARTWEGKRQTGEGPPYIKVGRLVRYRRSDVRAWLMEQTRQSTSQGVQSR